MLRFVSSHALRRRTAAAGLALLTALLLTTPAAKAAGSYINLSCDGRAPAIGDAYGGWVGDAYPEVGSVATNACPGGGLHVDFNSGSGAIPVSGSTGWTYTAPPSTYISGVDLAWGGWTRPWDGSSRGLIVIQGDQHGNLVYDSGRTVWPQTEHVAAGGMHDHLLRGRVYCDGPPGSPGCPNGASNGWMSLFAPAVTLADDTAPTAGTVGGTATASTSWKATETLSYAASDQGGGVARFRLYIDGQSFADHVVDTFGGHCVILGGTSTWTFGYPKPCPANVDAIESIDTTAIADGQHTVTAKVLDAGQREATLYSATKLVANHPPVNTVAPSWLDSARAGQPHVGEALVAQSGVWTGPSLTMTTAWQECDGNGANCVQVADGTAAGYTLTQADVGHRLRYAVMATNAAGSIAAYSLPSGVVQAQSSSVSAPVLQGGGGAASLISIPGLVGGGTSISATHVLVGRVAGESAGVACPHDAAKLTLQRVRGGTIRLANGRTGRATMLLTCAETGKAIIGARLEVTTRNGLRPAVASQIVTDGTGRAVLRLLRGPSRGIAVGYRMYADDPIARATAALKVVVSAKVGLRASRTTLRNGQAVRLSGRLAGGYVPRRGVVLAVQWQDGRRWRPFAQIRARGGSGRFRYAYRFTRTRRTVHYRLRVSVTRGQIDYPYVATASRPVTVTVAP